MVQKAAGYSLTGLRTYDVMFMVYGPSGSGKNTMVEALVKAMGTSQYAWPLDSSILAQGDGQAHGADLYHWAELRGRRALFGLMNYQTAKELKKIQLKSLLARLKYPRDHLVKSHLHFNRVQSFG